MGKFKEYNFETLRFLSTEPFRDSHCFVEDGKDGQGSGRGLI
jgi:hypothetical protein